MHIICHAFPSWRGDYKKSTVELMKELAARHSVLYIDYAFTLKDTLWNSMFNSHIPVKRILGIQSAIEVVELSNGASIKVLSLPPLIPYRWISHPGLFRFVQGINQRMINGRIHRYLNRKNIHEPVVVNAFNPLFNLKASALKPKATVYYCYDEIASCAWVSKHGPRLEAEYIQQADASVFTSHALQQKKALPDSKSYVITNGVAMPESLPDLKPINTGETIVGYIGTIDDRLDFTLLLELAKAFPGWKFEFVGRVLTDKANTLNHLPNVLFYGAVEPDRIPQFLCRFSAGIIPFVINNQTAAIYPMKLNEYLLYGLPVVMTDFAKLKDAAHTTRVAKRENFQQALSEEIGADDIGKRHVRQANAINNSWKKKAIEFETILLRYA
jgi:hypothetical protein